MHTTLSQRPAVEPDFTLPAVQAHYIDAAADHIAVYGLHEGDWWEQRYDEHGLWQPHAGYQDGSSCCTVGAIAVSLGYRSGDDVHNVVCGLDPDDVKPAAPHPVLAALMRALNAARVEDVFDWSDSAHGDQVVARLRDIAAQLRERATIVRGSDADIDAYTHCAVCRAPYRFHEPRPETLGLGHSECTDCGFVTIDRRAEAAIPAAVA